MESGRGPASQNAIKRACSGRVSQSTVGRVLSGETNSGVDTVQIIAELYGLDAWHLLLPNLNISNPQSAPLTDAEKLFYERIKAAYAELPKPP
jgi:transcriptional regulator with XRE-family HTH domain